MTRRALHFKSDAEWARFEHGQEKSARGIGIAMLVAFALCFAAGAVWRMWLC
ncbi:MAG TPA: hypothetical protein VFT98_16155 [Myxococcota bacterium]|nr:hypothetical protein [Myxococcota bacterium]